MKNKRKQSGMSLVEMVVVVAVAALLVGISIPAVRSLRGSFESQGGTRAMISAALTTARAIAAKEQRYAGVRFQTKYEEGDKASQYMIFIVRGEPKKMGNLVNGFIAVEGLEPIKLPDSIGVMDLLIRINHEPAKPGSNEGAKDTTDKAIEVADLDDSIVSNLEISGINRNIQDSRTFSIIFSPSGQVVIKDHIRVRNSDGEANPNPGVSNDDIFNSSTVVLSYKKAMFIQDDYAELGLGGEKSRRSFVIYDKEVFSQLLTAQQRYDYLTRLEKVFLNPHTGSMIKN